MPCDTRKSGRVVAFLLMPLLCGAQLVKRADLTGHILDFEDAQTGGAPKGWAGWPADTIFTDDRTVHSGKWAVRIEREADSTGKFSTINIGVPVDFAGARVELRGFVKTEKVSDFAGLWLREDGVAGMLTLDNMAKRALRGTNGWKEYSIVLPLRREATVLAFGFLVAGTGKGWADDLRLLVDGKPVGEAPALPRRQRLGI
jgi:hypothetical protein